LGRIDRQQQFLGAMVRKATSTGVLLNPLRLSDTVNATLASLTADTEMDPDRVKTLVRELQGTMPDQVSFVTVPITEQRTYLPDGGEAVRWDPEASSAIFGGLRSPVSVVDSLHASVPATPPASVPPSEVVLEVLNGSGVPGAASNAAAEFTYAEFVVAGVGNGSPTTRTTVVYDPEFATGLPTLQAALPDARFEEEPGHGEVMSVTVGPDFVGVLPVQVASHTPAEAPETPLAAVTSAAEAPCG
jgi:hypothetical protein